MNLKRKQFIEIPKPCHENWSEMEIVSLGRHCMVCEKKVVDFTRMSDQQVIAILHQNNYKMCGRFTENQLLIGFEKKKKNYLPFKLKAAASAILLLFSDKALAVYSTKATTIEINSKFNSKEVYSFAKQTRHSPADSNRRYLKGVVLDSITGETIPGVKLFFKGYETIRTMSDLDGNFILEIPSALMQDSFVLVVHAVSYRTNDYEMNLSSKDNLDNIKILLASDFRDIQSCTMIGIVVPVKKKWWKRRKSK
jgi:hypothetical protein